MGSCQSIEHDTLRTTLLAVSLAQHPVVISRKSLQLFAYERHLGLRQCPDNKSAKRRDRISGSSLLLSEPETRHYGCCGLTTGCGVRQRGMLTLGDAI